MELDDVSFSCFVSTASANRADNNCHVSLVCSRGRRAFSSRVGKRSSRAWLHLVGHSIALSLPPSTLVPSHIFFHPTPTAMANAS